MFRELSPDAQQLLTDYNWPGNIRELCNVCERLAVMAEGPVILKEDVLRVLDLGPRLTETEPEAGKPPSAKKFSELNDQIVREALIKAEGNKTKAAHLLGISRTTLWRKLAETSSQIP